MAADLNHSPSASSSPSCSSRSPSRRLSKEQLEHIGGVPLSPLEAFHASLSEGDQVETTIGTATILKRVGGRLRVRNESTSTWLEVRACRPVAARQERDADDDSSRTHMEMVASPAPQAPTPVDCSENDASPPGRSRGLHGPLDLPELSLPVSPMKSPSQLLPLSKASSSPGTSHCSPSLKLPPPLTYASSSATRSLSHVCDDHAVPQLRPAEVSTPSPAASSSNVITPPSTLSSATASTVTRVRIDMATFSSTATAALRARVGERADVMGSVLEVSVDRDGRTAGHVLQEIASSLGTTRIVAVGVGNSAYDCSSLLPAPRVLRVVGSPIRAQKT